MFEMSQSMDFFVGTVELLLMFVVDFDNINSKIRLSLRATKFVALNII